VVDILAFLRFQVTFC